MISGKTALKKWGTRLAVSAVALSMMLPATANAAATGASNGTVSNNTNSTVAASSGNTAVTSAKSQVNVTEQDVLDVLHLLSKYHVSGADSAQLRQAAIQGMLNYLNDPYTIFFSKQGYQSFNSSLEQHYVGIGISMKTDNEGSYIQQVFSGSPAENAGLQAGDYFVSVNGTDVSGASLQDISKLIKGKQDSSLPITIRRGSAQMTLTVKREPVQIPVVTEEMYPNQVGYIKIDTFSSNAGTEFTKALDQMKKSGIHSLIIDLRGNPGGYVSTAEEIASDFIKQGTLLHEIDRNHNDREIPIQNGSTVNFPVYILVNKNSASAAEILTGALQDYNVAKVIGTQTFGKGSMQQIAKLQSGSQLKVTTEHWITPNKRKVNGVGLAPDIKVDGSPEQLLAALRKAGVQDVSLNIARHSYSLDGVTLYDTINAVHQNNRVYLPAELLAAVAQADLQQDQAKQINMTQGTKHVVFSTTHEDLIVQNKQNYVSLSAFSKQFPDVSWVIDANHIIVHAKE